MKDFDQLTSYKDRWIYQQYKYILEIKRNLWLFTFHAPMGYVNFIVQLFLLVFAIPVYLGHMLDYFIEAIIIRKPRIVDIPSIKDPQLKKLAISALGRDFKEYKTAGVFILGIVVSLATIILSALLSKLFK